MTAEFTSYALPDDLRSIRVAVVGGGWAGLAAAVELVEAGIEVALFDAAPTLGGRARGLTLAFDRDEVALDNGQHLMIGAYTACLRLARQVGVRVVESTRPAAAEAGVLVRHRLRLDSTDGLSIVAARLPAPLSLLVGLARARGLRLAERAAMAAMLIRLRLHGWRVPPGENVSAMLIRMRQPDALRRRLWEPLAIAALNTSADEACAQTFVNVLRDSLGADARSADFILPSGTLSEAFPAPAARWLAARGCQLLLRTPVRGLRPDRGRWTLTTDRGEWQADAVVLATPPWIAARLLAPIVRAPVHAAVVAGLGGLEPESLATVYLGWPVGDCPELPAWIMLDEHGDPESYGQWLFDRGVQQGWRMAAVVVSARGRLAQVEVDALGAGIARQVARQLCLPPPGRCRVIVEKRATFKCRPDRPRITVGALADAVARTGSAAPEEFAALMLAGDHAWPEYPATLEAAVRSGVEAARRLIARRGR